MSNFLSFLLGSMLVYLITYYTSPGTVPDAVTIVEHQNDKLMIVNIQGERLEFSGIYEVKSNQGYVIYDEKNNVIGTRDYFNATKIFPNAIVPKMDIIHDGK